MTRKETAAERGARFRAAQFGRCPYCPEPLPERVKGAGLVMSYDHVFPRSLEPWRGQAGNQLLAHAGCNLRKSNRMPYPCEVIFLEATNLRLGVRLRRHPGDHHKHHAPTPEERAAQSARDKAAHRAKLQAEFQEAQARAAGIRATNPTFQAAHDLRKGERRPAVLWQLDALFATMAGLHSQRGRDVD